MGFADLPKCCGRQLDIVEQLHTTLACARAGPAQEGAGGGQYSSSQDPASLTGRQPTTCILDW